MFIASFFLVIIFSFVCVLLFMPIISNRTSEGRWGQKKRNNKKYFTEGNSISLKGPDGIYFCSVVVVIAASRGCWPAVPRAVHATCAAVQLSGRGA